jgi:endonuclease/exonuclease/phosphatase family metal-dependent hydrolase
VVLWLDTVRAWLPSILFVYGDAGTTPATQMGLFALAPFVGALILAAVLRAGRTGQGTAGALALLAVGALAMARLVVQASSGGPLQLWGSTAGVAAGLAWFVTLAARAVPVQALAVGLPTGLAADAALHTVLRSTGLVWRPGMAPWAVIVLVGAGAVGTLWMARRRTGPPEPQRPTRLAWALLGPILVLHALLAAMPSRVHTITGWPEPVAASIVLAGGAVGVLAAWWAAAAPSRAARIVGALLVLAGTAAALADPRILVALGHLTLPVGAGLVLGATFGAVRPAAAGDTGGWPLAVGTLTAAAGLLLFVVLAFTYYATYDILLPFPAEAALLVSAALVAVAAGAARSADAPATPARRPLAPVAAALALVVVGGTAAVALTSSPPRPEEGAGFPVRVMLYNLRMGFDVDGLARPDDQAGVVRGEEPDIVALNEVSRGWFTNASLDVLPRLSGSVGLPVAGFGPGADRVWGNAILSRYPVTDVRITPLPRAGAAMRRAMISAVVHVGGGEELGIVATHLSHRDEEGGARLAQVRELAAEARRLAESGRPVIVIGDLNAEPQDPELEPLTSWLVDASAGAGPVATFPSTGPVQHIDHIFMTPDLVASEFTVTDSTASDHQGIAVTLGR